MQCVSELTLSIYADGELEPVEAARLESHLEVCESCRKLMTALREESAALSQTLRAPASVVRAEPRPVVNDSKSLKWGLAAVVIAAMGINALSTELSQIRLPAAIAWLSPANLWLHLSLFLSSLDYLLNGGVVMFVRNLSVAAFAVFTLACLRSVVRRPALSVAGAVFLALALPSFVSATELRFPKGKDGTVIVPARETIDDTLFVAGQLIVLEGNVTGDVIATGERVRMTGAVGGSLICASKELEVDGEVGGDVYSMNETVMLRGSVRRNVHAMAQRLGLETGAAVARDVFVLAEGSTFGGRVGGDARVIGRWVEVPGRVENDLCFKGESLVVSPTGLVEGDVNADVKDKNAVRIEPSSGISEAAERHGVLGSIKIHEKQPRSEKSRFLRSRFYVWQLVRLAAACVTGLVLFWLAPGIFERRRETGMSLLTAGGIGFAALVVVPIASLGVGATLIGLPLGLLALAAWLAMMYLASVFVAALIGRSVLPSGNGNGRSFLLTLLLGLLILRIAVNLPWIGGIVGFIVLLIGMGMAVTQASRCWRRQRMT